MLRLDSRHSLRTCHPEPSFGEGPPAMIGTRMQFPGFFTRFAKKPGHCIEVRRIAGGPSPKKGSG